MKFIFDLSNIKHQNLVDAVLKNWEVIRHSDRCFEISGRQWSRNDIGSLWQAIGAKGHVFVFDLQNGQERYHPKNPRPGGKRQQAPDDVLDAQTLRLIEQFALKESPLDPPDPE